MAKRYAVLAIAALLACSAPPDSELDDGRLAYANTIDPAPFGLTATQYEGREIYETLCWTCHGTAGRGDGPAVTAANNGSRPVIAPPSLTTSAYQSATQEELLDRFQLGLDGTDPRHPHMQYVRSLLRPERFAAALAFVPALGYPPEIPGSALAGRDIYAFRCAGCHGHDGRGHGSASGSLVQMPPADFTTDSLIARKDWQSVFRRVREGGRAVHGSAMPPWGDVFTDEETWDLVAYLATFQPATISVPTWLQ